MSNLKKVLLAVLVAVVAMASAEAKTIAFGVKAGLNVNKLSFNQDLVKSSNSCGWEAGVMADITVPILGFGLDASVMYARMNNSTNPMINGSSLSEDADGTNLYGKNFIEVPINLKYKFTLPVVGSIMKPYIFTGPNFAFRIDKAAQVLDLKSQTFQMAWNVGLGLEFINHLQIGASYGFGCNSVVKAIGNATGAIDPNQVVNSKVKNNYWTVTAAYLF